MADLVMWHFEIFEKGTLCLLYLDSGVVVGMLKT
jgi:hypothetical protein